MIRSFNRVVVTLGLVLLIVAATAAAAAAKPVAVSPIEQLGAAIAFDANLSEPAGQACADCHDPRSGFADRVRSNPVSEGVIAGMFGGRNAPSWAYTAWSPVMYFDEAEGLWIGGMFWDGRATGWTLGSPLAEQAQGPFLNPTRDAQREQRRGHPRHQHERVCRPLPSGLPGHRLDRRRPGLRRHGLRHRRLRGVAAPSTASTRASIPTWPAARVRSPRRRSRASSSSTARPSATCATERAFHGLDRNRRGQGAVHGPHLRQPRPSGEPCRLGADRQQ